MPLLEHKNNLALGNIGDPDVIDHCDLLWGGLRSESSLGRRPDNVIIPFDLTQLFCPDLTLAAGPPSGFTTDVGRAGYTPGWRSNQSGVLHHPCTAPVYKLLCIQ